MADVTAQMVKELRERTGAGMMDCKAALQETQADMEQAVDLLRKKGLAKAAKRAGRIAADGLIATAITPHKGVLVEVNSETDFVARNDFFQGLVRMIADAAVTAGTDVDAINNAKVGSHTVADSIAQSIAKIGENITLRRATSIEVGNGVIASYVHNSVSEGLGKIGVLVALESSGKADELNQIGRKVAMHVAASNPQAIDSAGLSAEVIRREKEVLTEKFKQQGKPANIIDKIVESGLKTFYKEVCLLDQDYIHDVGKSVAQAVKEAESAVGAPIKVKAFARYVVGEGIDKPESE